MIKNRMSIFMRTHVQGWQLLNAQRLHEGEFMAGFNLKYCMEAFWEEVDFESKLKEGVLLQKRFKILYRIMLVVSGILFFFVGWIMWNIPLESEDGTPRSLFVDMNEAVGYDLAWPLFLTGFVIQLFIAPWFAFSGLSRTGRLSMLVPKEIREYRDLKRVIEFRQSHGARNPSKEIEDLYWEVLMDDNHRYHNEIIRYKWMDKVKWKHRPDDFFGHVRYTKETGGASLGSVVPKTSEAYRNSNATFDENHKVNGIANPAIHPLRRLLPPLFLFFLTSVSSLMELLVILQSGESNALKEDAFRLFALPCFFAWFIVQRNTDLLPSRRRKQDQNADDLRDEALSERLDLLRNKYVLVREDEESQEAIESINIRSNGDNQLSTTTAIFLMVSIATIWVGLDSNPLDFTLAFGFSLLTISLLAAKHFRLTQFALSFKGYRVTQKHLHLLDGIYSKKLKRNEIPEHSCIRMIDLYPTNTVRYYRGPNVCLHLIRLVRDEPDPFARMGQQIIKPGYKLNGYDETFFEGVGPENDGVKCWVEDIKIRFEFKTKAEQREFAEKLASDLSLPLREHWRWNDKKKSPLFWLGSDWDSIPENLKV